MNSDTKLELRAYGGMTVLIQSTDAFLEAATAGQPALAALPAQKRGALFLLVVSALLFDAQQFFWEHVLVDKTKADRFEKFFYTVFRRITNVNPSRRLKDYRAYVEAEGEGGRAAYLAKRICEEILGGAEAGVEAQLNTLTTGFQKPLHAALGQIWDMPDAVLAEGKALLDKISNREPSVQEPSEGSGQAKPMG